jgi:hypothetical protein
MIESLSTIHTTKGVDVFSWHFRDMAALREKVCLSG